MKKWEELNKNEQVEWNNFAIKHQKMLLVVKYISEHGCPFCKFKPSSWGNFEFHALTTHGYPKEVLTEMIKIV